MATEVDQGVEVAAKVNKAKSKQLKGEPDKASKPATKARPAPKRNHPPYLQMVSEAISSLKERSGSSQPAIAKYLEDKYQSELPPNFKRILSVQLKNMSNSGKLTKVKHSFKLSSGRSKPTAAAKPKPEGSKPAVAKPKKVKKAASKATIAASSSKAKASSTEARDLRAASRSKAKQAAFLPSTLTTRKRKPAISALNSPKRAKRLTK